MEAFESYLFEEDEIAAHNMAVLRERPLLISYLIVGLGFLLSILELVKLGVFLLIIGAILHILARFSVFTPKFRTGQITKRLKISEKFIQIDENVFEFSEVQSVHIKMYFHEGQLETDFQQNWKSDGTNNEIILVHKNQELKFKYWLPSYHHVLKLRNLDFPENVSRDDRVF